MASASVSNFLDALRKCRLLDPAQLDEVARQLLPRHAEPKALAKVLLQRGWLTPYQANQLVQGRGQDLVLGVYVLLERLGEGAMGQVFKARHQKLGHTVALKVIRKERLANPAAILRFQREIQATAQLAHPNIVAAYDAGQEGDTHFFAMEYVEGIDLARLVKQSGPLSVGQACDYIRQAAEGLQHAHEHGLVHRDIKPHNLVLTARELAIKLLDMGLARLRPTSGEDKLSGTLTQEDTVIGTPDYLAPEQALNARQADIRSDLYSLGCTLYFLLTGRPPFQAGALTEILIKHQLEEATPVEKLRPEVSAGVAAVVSKLMAKRPEDRYQTPAELIAALTRTGNAALPPQAAGHAEPPAPEAVPVSASAAAAPAPANQATEPTAPDWRAVTYTSSEAPAAPPRRVRRMNPKQRLLALAGVSALLLGSIVVLVILLMRKDPPSDTKQEAKPEPRPAPPVLEKEITNSIGMKLKRIPAGKFLMGSPEAEPGRSPHEGPQHEVEITKPFYLGAYEVTQKQFEQVMASNPSHFHANNGGGPDHPVDNVMWEEAVEFCHKLSALPAERKAGRVYRLPTEAEWEYACRAGTTTAYFFSSDPGSLDQYAWFSNNAGGRTHPVGRLKPNPWGLYDLCGNLWEWCQDCFSPAYYRESPREDPQGPSAGDKRVLRGGAYAHNPGAHGGVFRSAYRHPHNGPGQRDPHFGFRVACVPAAKEDDKGWVALFNGKDLKGWKVFPEGAGNWKVQDGLLVGDSGNGPSFLYHEDGDFTDFHSRMEVQINRNAYSGQLIRARFGTANAGDFQGYVAKINIQAGEAGGRDKTGSIWKALGANQHQLPAVSSKVVEPDAWFVYEVIAQGNRIIIKVNGETVTDWTDPDNPWTKGALAVQLWGQDAMVKVRKIEVKPLPTGKTK